MLNSYFKISLILCASLTVSFASEGQEDNKKLNKNSIHFQSNGLKATSLQNDSNLTIERKEKKIEENDEESSDGSEDSNKVETVESNLMTWDEYLQEIDEKKVKFQQPNNEENDLIDWADYLNEKVENEK